MSDQNFRRLGPTFFADLIAPALREDDVIRAIAEALDLPLKDLIRAIPNLLLWARLTPDANYLSAPMRRLAEFAGGLKQLSDEELELLAWQEHVDFWRPEWPRSVREDLVRSATRWHRIKGTPAGMKMAFDLFGYRADIEEHTPGRHWAEYQLCLHNITAANEIREIIEIATEMQPARCKLWRMYSTDYDVRPLIFSRGKWSHHWYSFFSGVVVPDIDDDTLISLGWRTAVLMPQPDVDCFFAGDEECGLVIPWDRLTSDVTLAAEEEYSAHFCEPVWITEQWSGHWDHRPWAVLLDWVKPGAITVWHNPGIDMETAVRLPDDLDPDIFCGIEAVLEAEIPAEIADDIHPAVETEAGISIPSLISDDFFPAIEVDLASQFPETQKSEIRASLEADLGAQFPSAQATVLPGIESVLGTQLPGIEGDVQLLVELQYDQETELHWSGHWDERSWS
ncbi:phage tail protein I [Desulfosarcina sp. OttesenSCG-928-A07]|nr:phage tail protein I [Desulfosarcina sp. OttesenSCG-928-G17]MDL2329098.1 phage tail protein I [Desulfosarcina sp. OttesenSCG-928-A07]